VKVVKYEEIMKERESWDETARKMEDEAKVRGCKDIKFLKKQIVKVHKFLDKRAVKGLMLDVGCGNAQFTVNVADLFNFVVGLDVSAEMIKRCKVKLNNLGFVIGSATDLPFKNGVSDSIMSLSTLQHIKPRINVEKALLEMSRCSKDHSFIFLTFWDTPNSPKSVVKQILSAEGYKLEESLFSKLRLKKFVKLWGERLHRSGIKE
jgi:ubiquinone/menaquinone biosynthesis C-methylase UbiE